MYRICCKNNSFWVTCGHFTLPVSQETSGRLKSPTTTVSNLLDVLQISFILDSNMLFIGVVKLGDLYMPASYTELSYIAIKFNCQ